MLRHCRKRNGGDTMAKRIDRSTPLFQVTDLCQYFNVGRGKVLKAVDHVHFTIYK